MRQIGHLENEAAAHTFSDFLYVQGIENQIEAEKGHGWAVWIHAEERLERAAQLLADFRANPTDPKYRAQAQGAAELREQAQSEKLAYEKRVKGRRNLFRPLAAYGYGPLTFMLIVSSVVVFLLSRLGQETERTMYLYITDWVQNGRYIHWEPGLPEIRHGEIWRLITPIFLHFHPLHIFFNLLWLLDLGSMIEARQRTWVLAVLVIVLASVSNFSQYLMGGPMFGGMSGVVYGLLGYVWIRGKFDPASGLFLHQSTVTMMIIWLFLCMTGLIGSIANTAHVVGLLAGMAWGYLSALRRR